MHSHFVIPDLFWPARDAADAYAALALPALETVLARGRRSVADAAGFEGWLASRFGLTSPEDGLAAFRAAGDALAPGDATWIAADPVHLAVDRDRLLLGDPAALDITTAEAEALCTVLREHFAADGLRVHAPHPHRWYVAQAADAALTTTPLAQAIGRSIDERLPHGADGARWRTRATEAQMLLHAHPVNTAREARGAPAVNSVWLWGAGRWRALAKPDRARWYADDPLVAGLVAANQGRSVSVPASFAALAASVPDDAVATVVLDALRTPAASGDLDAWRERLARIEAHWIAPALAALRAGRIGMLSLHAPGEASCLHVETTAGDLRYFWRRARPLARYVESEHDHG
jgi:hypothetical protein